MIDPTTVPFGLLNPDTRSQDATETDANETPAMLYFVKAKALVGVQRGVHVKQMTRRAAAVLQALASGPDEGERGRGLSTAVPTTLRLKAAGFHDGQIIVDIAGDPSGVTAVESPLAVAQIVLSLTSLPRIDEVRLTRDHQPIEAPLADGSLTSAPLTGNDYDALRESHIPSGR